jgi:hypothetical protein
LPIGQLVVAFEPLLADAFDTDPSVLQVGEETTFFGEGGRGERAIGFEVVKGLPYRVLCK